MKPVVTWVVVANGRDAKVLENRGPGKGLDLLARKGWQAESVRIPDDKPGVGHSIAGPGVSAVEQTDTRLQTETKFAKHVLQELSNALRAKEFDRLIIACGPHMLGLFRAHLEDDLRSVVIGEIAKDFSAQPIHVLEARLGDFIAV
ncbi:MAG: host attachment protein [Pseudomonadota bacterium]